MAHHGHQEEGKGTQEVLDSSGPSMRIGQGGLAFAVGLDSHDASNDMKLDSAIHRGAGAGEPLLTCTAEQISEKLAAADARREAGLEDVRKQAAEESAKVDRASENRQQAVEEVKEALDAKLEKADANQQVQREAFLAKLHQEEIHHQEVLHRRAEVFHAQVMEMDERLTQKEGNRNLVLGEIVDKVKEHNDRVKLIHDEMMAHRQHADFDIVQQRRLHNSYTEASTGRDQYVSSAEARLKTENIY